MRNQAPSQTLQVPGEKAKKKENYTPFMQKICQNTTFGSSGFSFQFLISKIQGSGFSFQFLKNYNNCP